MSWLQVKNNAEGSLNGAITDVAASMVVASAVPFPTSTPFRLTIEDEIVEVTNIAGTTFTITRGVEGTTGAAHADATPVYLNVLASIIQQLQAHPVMVRKTADETVYNSTTLQNDDHLFLPVLANEVWKVEFRLMLAMQAGAIKTTNIRFIVPTNGSFRWNISGDIGVMASASSMLVEKTTDPLELSGIAGATKAVYIAGLYIGGNTAGNLQLQWAQTAAETKNHTMLTNSYLIGHNIP